MIDGGKPLDDARWIAAYNAGSNAIPGNGVVYATGVDTDGVLSVTAPTDDSQTGLLVNGPDDIPAGDFGQCHRTFPAGALYDLQDGTPANGDNYGSVSGSHLLKKGKTGFKIVGGADDEAGIVNVMEDPTGSGGVADATHTQRGAASYPGGSFGSSQWLGAGQKNVDYLLVGVQNNGSPNQANFPAVGLADNVAQFNGVLTISEGRTAGTWTNDGSGFLFVYHYVAGGLGLGYGNDEKYALVLGAGPLLGYAGEVSTVLTITSHTGECRLSALPGAVAPFFSVVPAGGGGVASTGKTGTIGIGGAATGGIVTTLGSLTAGGALSGTYPNPSLATVGVTSGGTGLTSLTAHYVLVGAGTSAVSLIAPSATSGIPFISQGSSADPTYGTAVVAGGGTGRASHTAYAVICGGTTSTGAQQSIASVGTAGQVLTSNGAGALPTFQAASGGTVTSVNIAFSGAAFLSVGSAVTTSGNISVTWTGTTGDILYASAANTWSKLAGNITTDTLVLTQTGNGAASNAPAWGTIASGGGLVTKSVTLTAAALTAGGASTGPFSVDLWTPGNKVIILGAIFRPDVLFDDSGGAGSISLVVAIGSTSISNVFLGSQGAGTSDGVTAGDPVCGSPVMDNHFALAIYAGEKVTATAISNVNLNTLNHGAATITILYLQLP